MQVTKFDSKMVRIYVFENTQNCRTNVNTFLILIEKLIKNTKF